MINKIEKYTQIHGISGDEYLVKKELEKTFLKNNTKIFNDNLGSICTLIPTAKKNAKNIGIFVHQDEVGLIISQILENGNFKVANVGGISSKNLINQRVILNTKNNKHLGVILANYDKEINKLLVSDLEIDFGFSNKEEVLSNDIHIGDYINFIGEFHHLNNDKYVTKAADDRIGCAIIEKLYEDLSKIDNGCNIYLGATISEEIGLKGAGTLLRSLEVQFDQILIVDVSPIDNIKENSLGEGFLLRIAEPRGLYDYKGNNEIKKIAKENNIKYQPYFSKGSTDGAMMQITNNGNKTNAICIPALNLHTCNTIFDSKDVEAALQIIGAYIQNETKI